LERAYALTKLLSRTADAHVCIGEEACWVVALSGWALVELAAGRACGRNADRTVAGVALAG
jgi:hypothetical protein